MKNFRWKIVDRETIRSKTRLCLSVYTNVLLLFLLLISVVVVLTGRWLINTVWSVNGSRNVRVYKYMNIYIHTFICMRRVRIPSIKNVKVFPIYRKGESFRRSPSRSLTTRSGRLKWDTRVGVTVWRRINHYDDLVRLYETIASFVKFWWHDNRKGKKRIQDVYWLCVYCLGDVLCVCVCVCESSTFRFLT